MPSELDLTVEYTIRYTVCKKKLDVELLMAEKKFVQYGLQLQIFRLFYCFARTISCSASDAS